MNCFTLYAIGRLAANPELTEKNGTAYCRFALIGDDYGGKDREEIKTSVYFVAFNGLAEAIGQHAKSGDQLIVQAQIRANNYADKDTGELKYGYSHIVQGFTFGAPGKAKRAALAQATPQPRKAASRKR